MEFDKFLREVQRWVKRPVVDETGLPGGYDVLFNWEAITPESLPGELRRQLEIPAAVERRPMDLLVVKPAK